MVQGSAFFLGGVGLVVWGWAIIGMAVETYGFWLLFSGFFPTVLGFLRRLPYLGGILDLPVLKTVRLLQASFCFFDKFLLQTACVSKLTHWSTCIAQVINRFAPAQSLPI
jgi:hypothetical protein